MTTPQKGKTRTTIIAIALVLILLIGAGIYILIPKQPQQQAQVAVIRFAGWSAGETEMKNYQKIIQDFQAANPNIVVKYEVITQMFSENILASYAAGAAPDIFYVDSAWAPTFISKGVLYPIGDKLPKDFIDQFYPFLLEPFKGPDGKIYGLPKDWSVLSLFYNKKLFAQAGVPEPTDSWTWDDLFNAAKTIYQKTGKPGLVIQAELNRWVPYLVSNGAPPPSFNSATDAAYFDKPEVRNALTTLIQKIQEGRKEGYIVLPSDVNAGWNGEAFGKQLAAMTIEGSWTIPYIADQFPDFKYGTDWDISLLPKGSAGRASMAYTVALGVNAKTENLDAALKFIQYVEGPVGQKLLVVKMGQTLPSIKTLANDPDLWPSHAKELKMVNQYTRVALFFYGPKTGQNEGDINQLILAAVKGEISINDAINLMKTKVAESFKS
jgi:multiple sugar transport system substrate-binding protein